MNRMGHRETRKLRRAADAWVRLQIKRLNRQERIDERRTGRRLAGDWRKIQKRYEVKHELRNIH